MSFSVLPDIHRVLPTGVDSFPGNGEPMGPFDDIHAALLMVGTLALMTTVDPDVTFGAYVVNNDNDVRHYVMIPSDLDTIHALYCDGPLS